jgi:hypothetical protein
LVARLAGLGGDAADPSQIRDDPRFRRFLAELIARDTSWAASSVAAGLQERSRARGTRADGVKGEGKGAGTPALGGRDAAGMYGEQPREHWTRVTQRCDDTSMTVVQLAFS